MSISLDLHPDESLLHTCIDGGFDAQEARAHIDALLDLDAPYPRRLVVMRNLEDAGVVTNLLRDAGFALADSGRDPGDLRVAVVGEDDLAYGTARMFANFRSGSGARVEVFRDVDRARAWLFE